MPEVDQFSDAVDTRRSTERRPGGLRLVPANDHVLLAWRQEHRIRRRPRVGAEVGRMTWSQRALRGFENAYRLTRNLRKTGFSVASSPRQHYCCGPGGRGFESP